MTQAAPGAPAWDRPSFPREGDSYRLVSPEIFRALDPPEFGPRRRSFHGHQDAPLRRFEPVAGVRKCTADDDAHGVTSGSCWRNLILDVQQLNTLFAAQSVC